MNPLRITPSACRLACAALLLACVHDLGGDPVGAQGVPPGPVGVAHVAAPSSGSLAASVPSAVVRRSITAVELRGEVRLKAGTTMLGTPFGGLSGITYDAANQAYFAQSDDRSDRAPARFYRLALDLADGRLDDGDVAVTGVVTLTDTAGSTFRPGSIDPEGIALSPTGSLFVSSEGDSIATPPVAPFVNEFGRNGRQLSVLPVPAYYVPVTGGGVGVRNNLAFEPLAVSPNGNVVFSATENALAQDGPVATFETGSPSRLLAWDRATGRILYEHVYPVSPVPRPAAPVSPTVSASTGLVELIALDDGGTLLAMERSFVAGVGTTVRLFECLQDPATNVAGISALRDPGSGIPWPYAPIYKRLVADIGELGVVTDNIEGMTLGPRLPDGRQLLILVSDDNFSPLQVTQFVALAVTIQSVGGSPTIYLPIASPQRRR